MLVISQTLKSALFWEAKLWAHITSTCHPPNSSVFCFLHGHLIAKVSNNLFEKKFRKGPANQTAFLNKVKQLFISWNKHAHWNWWGSIDFKTKYLTHWGGQFLTHARLKVSLANEILLFQWGPLVSCKLLDADVFLRHPWNSFTRNSLKYYCKDVLLVLGFTSTGEIDTKAHLLVIFFKDIVRDLVGKKCNS